MNQPDLNKNKRFAELVGICWCEPEYYNEDIDKCHKCGAIYSTGRRSTAHPDFAADPRIVLREMMKREDWPEFSNEIGPCKHKPDISPFNYPPMEASEAVYYEYILDTTGKLRDAAIEWLEAGASQL